MRGWKLAAVTADAIALLTAITVIVASPAARAAAKAGNVTEARVLAQAATGHNWPVLGGDFGDQHYSPLKQINASNVNELGLAWSLDIDSPMGLDTEPIVVDGIIYATGSLDRVYAVDAKTGHLLWKYDPHTRLSVMRNSWAARSNRGVAVWRGKVYFATGDCRLFALDAASGQKLWDSPVCVDTTQTGITGVPTIGDGKVYIGYNGGDSGVRGSVVAFDANTGKLTWRFWNVPGDPSKPFENQALEMAAKTWSGDHWWEVGGGDVWDSITYDPSTKLVIYGTAGATPEALYGDRANMKVSGPRLFSDCIVAVHADTGQLAWYFPTNEYAPGGDVSPEDFHVLVSDLAIAGKMRHVAMAIPRFGTLFVLDAHSGELISQKSLALRPAAQLSPRTANGVPRTSTGHNWWPMSYSDATGLLYIPAYDDVGSLTGFSGTAVGRLIAWDPIEQSARWSVEDRFPVNGGVLSTGGGLVFQGQATGEFDAYSADRGEKLWSIKTGSAIDSVPVTYLVGEDQYVLMPVGLGSTSRNFAPVSTTMATPDSKLGPSRLLAFKLNGTMPFPYPHVTIPRVPRPPEQTADAATIKRGEEVFNKFVCADCHGMGLDGSGQWKLNGTIPDLRYMPADVHDQFLAIVLAGTHRQNGMPGFGVGAGFPFIKTKMTVRDALALHAYIVQLQWKAFKNDP